MTGQRYHQRNILVMEKFLDYPLDPSVNDPNTFNTWTYKWLHSRRLFMVKYSVPHFADFFRGMKKLVDLFAEGIDLPSNIKFILTGSDQIIKRNATCKISSETKPGEKFLSRQNLYFGYHLRNRYKTNTLELIDIFSGLMHGIRWQWR